MTATTTTASVEVPGARLHVVEDGSRSDPPVVLLHAGIADLRSWDGLVPLLVADGYRVVRFIPRRGCDDQRARPVFERRRPARGARCAGHRSGGPGRQLDGRCGRLRHGDQRPDRSSPWSAWPRGSAASMAARRRSRTSCSRRWTASTRPSHPTRRPSPRSMRASGSTAPGSRATASRRRSASSCSRWTRQLRARSGDRGSDPAPATGVDRLADLRCPVLAVAGDLDVSEVALTARHLEANAPDARAVVWPDVAHMIGMEVPDRLAAAILEFLAPLPRWS